MNQVRKSTAWFVYVVLMYNLSVHADVNHGTDTTKIGGIWMTKTIDLISPDDIRRVREKLIVEQHGRCAVTDVPTALRDFHLDHCHDSEQLVRGAANKHANMLLGKLENLEARYLKHWYPHSLAVFLRACAEYLEKPKDLRYRHPGWMQKLMTKFSKLKEPQKDKVLAEIGYTSRPNSISRKAEFMKAMKSKRFGFDHLSSIINKTIG